MDSLKILLYRIKNSNLILYFSFNPFQWRIKPFLGKMPTYADDWLIDPYLIEYKFSFLMIKISVFIETGKQDEYESLYD